MAGLGWRRGKGTAPVKSATFQIRRATCGDAAGILECLGAAFVEYRADYTEGAYLDTVLTPESLEARLSTSTIFVALDGMQQVIGTVGCSQADQEEGHIRGMGCGQSGEDLASRGSCWSAWNWSCASGSACE